MRLRVLQRGCVAALALGLLAANAQGAELRVLAAEPARNLVTQIAADFTRQTGTTVKFTFGTVSALKHKLEANERADLLVLTPPVLDELMFSEVVTLGRRVPVGRVGLGVVMKAGVKPPGLATPDALRKALLSAEAIVSCNPKTGAAGVQTAHLLRRLGIEETVRARTRIVSGETEMLAVLSKGKGTELGIAPIGAVLAKENPGVQLAAPLPKDLQSYTTYTVAVVQSTRLPAEAQAFLLALTSPEARQRLAAAGFERAP